MRCTTLLALLMGVMLYLVMGALVFRTLESHGQNQAYQDLLATKHTFLDNKSCISELDFHELVKGVVIAVEAGLDVNTLTANFTSRWDLTSAFFFCGTIITTIGFGNLSPRTTYGQLFCVCYALVGIPMFGILLAGVGDHMGTVLRRAVAKIETLFLRRKVRPTTVRLISAVLSILIGCLIFLAVPTVVFQKVECWSFLESLYFVVITLTTVGFGDFVPGDGREGMFFKPLVLLWIVFGMAYFASILTMITKWLKVLSKKTRAEMEELRAHATDWTQNIQNMSMDFRIPNPLEFNDPFLLQRRRWKRSERRRIRRGAQGTLGQWARSNSENGHLPNRWAGLSSSLSQLEARSSLERARPRVSNAGGEPGPRPRPGRRDPSLQMEAVPLHHLLARSFSLPVAHSSLHLDSAGAALQGGSLSGSESPFDSRSDVSSSASSVFSVLRRFQPCLPVGITEEGGAADSGTALEMSDVTSSEKCECVESTSMERKLIPDPGPGPGPGPDSDSSPGPSPAPCFSPAASFSSSLHHMLLPSAALGMASLASCQLLDFFGENLAFIDESSDTLSDQPAANEERRRRPRKPKRRSIKRRRSHEVSPLQVRRPHRELQPPSNPPTPPPDSPLSDLAPAENHTGSSPAL